MPKSKPKKFAAWLSDRWRRRLAIAAVSLLALGVISRLVMVAVLPSVIQHVAAHYGMTASYERLELYLLDGDVGIWHFSLAPIEGGDPLVQADYNRCHISTLDLLRGRLTIRRLEAEGVDLLVERKADGTIPLLQRFAQWTSAIKVSSSAGAGQPPTQIDLSSPLEIDAFRLTSVHTHIVDAAVSPPLDMRAELNLRLTDLDSTIRPTRFEMDLTAGPILDLLHVEGTGTAKGQALDAQFQVQVKGLHPLPAAGYLLPMGIRPTSGNIALEMNGRIHTTGVVANPQAIAANLELDGLTATADGRQAAALDKITVNAGWVDFQTALINQVIIEGGQCQLQRDSHGEVGLGGLQVVQPSVVEERLVVPLTEALALIPQHWGIGELVMRNLNASIHDDAVMPSADLALQLKELTVSSFSPDDPNGITTIHGRFAAPAIAGSIRLDGQCRPFAGKKDIDATLSVDGIRTNALQPYLDELGLASDFAGGAFSATFHADVTPSAGGILTTNARLSKLVLNDKSELFALDSVDLSNAVFDPAVGLLHIKSIDISGPRMATHREVDGMIAALGLHTKPRPAQAPPIATLEIGGTPTPPSQEREFVFSIPKLRIDHFNWQNVGLQFDDLAVTPSASLAVSNAGVELDDLNIDSDPKDGPLKPGRLHAWLQAPNLARSIVADGTITPGPDGMSADLSVDGTGITAERIAGYFENASVQPVLHDGSFHFTTHLAVQESGDGVASTLAVKDLSFKEGASDLLTVAAANIDGASLRENELKVGRVDIQSPRLTASRDADGAILLGGLRIPMIGPAGPAAASTVTLQRVPSQFVSILKELDVTDASLQWTDRAVQPAAVAHIAVSAKLEDMVVGKSAPPGKVSVLVHEDHALDRLTITGLVTPSLDTPSAHLDIDAAGIRAGSLGSYAASYGKINLQDGRFHATLDAAMSPNPAGGRSGHLLVTDLDYRDGASESALCRLDALRLTAARFDVPGKVIAVDEIGLDNLNASVARSKDGSIRLLGMTFGAAGGVPVSAAAPAPAVGDAKAIGIATLAALANKTYPLVTVNKLDIGIDKLALSDESRPDAAPLTLSDMRLLNHGPIELLGENPQTRPPVDLELTGAADPVVQSLDVRARLSPFAEPAQANIDLDLSGIHGSGATDLFPGLKSEIDGNSLTDGRFKAQLSMQLKAPRADPLDFNLSNDFGLDLAVKGVEFRDGPNGPVLAGLDQVTADDIQVQPKISTVVVHDLEVTNPAARVFRDAAGIHVLGCIIKPALWQPATTEQPVSPATTPAPGEIAINRLLVSGLNFNVEDRVCDPPLIAPMNGLDLEVRGLTSRMISEDKSCRFSLLLNSGNVSLPRRVHGNELAGAVKDAFAEAAGKKVDMQTGMEQRDLFSQVEASGIVSLYPQPKGWVKTSVSALDLAALKGEAKDAGVSLNGGTFDSTVDLRLDGDGSMDARARFVLTDLELSEPANGPIVRHLNVNAPLDVVIAALQDQDGSITIPIDVPIRSGHIAGGDLALAATGAVASVVVTAVATTPLKASDTVLSIFGNEKTPKNDQPITLNFDPADHSLSQENIRKLSLLLDRAKEDDTLELTLRQELGGGDALRAAILANPSPADCQNLAYSLRLEKNQLLAARDAAAQRAKAQLASGFGADSGAAIQRLRDISVALATTDDAMDQMYDMQRPGADRQANRRTRAACLQIGQDRLLVVREALLAAGIPGMAQRVKVTHATFNAADGSDGGKVIIVLNHKKGE